MQLNLTGHHIDITPALREYVDSKLDKLERHCDDIESMHVILTVEKLEHKAEATIHVRGDDLFADSTHEDMYAAIDGMIGKLDRQARKHKEKKKDHKVKEAQKRAAQAEL